MIKAKEKHTNWRVDHCRWFSWRNNCCILTGFFCSFAAIITVERRYSYHITYKSSMSRRIRTNYHILQRYWHTVLVLLTHFKGLLSKELWLKTGTRQQRRFEAVQDIELTPVMQSNILAYHAITGRDTVSQPSRHGKKTDMEGIPETRYTSELPWARYTLWSTCSECGRVLLQNVLNRYWRNRH